MSTFFVNLSFSSEMNIRSLSLLFLLLLFSVYFHCFPDWIISVLFNLICNVQINSLSLSFVPSILLLSLITEFLKYNNQNLKLLIIVFSPLKLIFACSLYLWFLCWVILLFLFVSSIFIFLYFKYIHICFSILIIIYWSFCVCVRWLL